MMEFTFEDSAWELSLRALQPGSIYSATGFLAMMESESEDAVESALEILDEKDILLDISSLSVPAASAETAVRLRLEKQLVETKQLPGALEETDPLRLYLEEVASIPAFGDPQPLAERFAQGDESVSAQLTNLLLSLAVEESFASAGNGVLLMDLIQEASLGMWQAVLAFREGDITAQCRRQIRRSIAKAVTMQARACGVGQKMRQALEDFRAVDEDLLAKLGRNPTLEEIAQQLHLTLEETEMVATTLEAARTVSRAKTQTSDPEPTPDDEMAVEDTAYFQMRQRISELLSVLSEEEAKLLTLRFGLEGGLPLSPEETGRKLGLTPAEVVAAETAALAKMRNGN